MEPMYTLRVSPEDLARIGAAVDFTDQVLENIEDPSRMAAHDRIRAELRAAVNRGPDK